MMNRVGGMPLKEQAESLPPGFSNNDIESLSDFVEQSNVNEDDGGAQMQPANLRDIIDKRKIGNKRNREMPYIHNDTIKIIDTAGKEIDRAALARRMTERPATLLGTNEKVGKTGILKISLPAYKGLYYDEKEKEFKVVNTCPNAGSCKIYCYAQKGNNVMFDVASISKMRILNFLLNNWEGFRYKLIDEIETNRIKNEKKGIKTIMRWHDSGDFISEKYIDLAMDIARQTPNVLHYAYTKMVSMSKKADVPNNFIFRYSIDREAPENDLINKETDKHADVVPKKLFTDLSHTVNVKGGKNKFRFNSHEALNEFKNRLAKHYNIDVNTILTFNEMMNTPEEGNNKWNVIVTPSDGDTAAHRSDVLGVYLLIH